MFELHITGKPEFTSSFIDIAQRYKLKLISHDNLDINGNFLYSETMIAEKCKDLSELNNKIELLFRVAKQHNLMRVKIESKVSDDFKCNIPYKMGANYFEFHIDIKINRITKELSNICKVYKLSISKNPEKDTFMLTYRTNSIELYKHYVKNVMETLEEYDFKISRVIKEYCFCDDNIEVDSPWLNTYKIEVNQ